MSLSVYVSLCVVCSLFHSVCLCQCVFVSLCVCLRVTLSVSVLVSPSVSLSQCMCEFRGAVVVEGMEADDRLSIEQMRDWYCFRGSKDNEETHSKVCRTVICSLDKDLDNTPGWHYNWVKDNLYWIDEHEALTNFYCQMLTGDSVDNILGLYGVGKSSTLLRNVRGCGSELDMFSLVREQYAKRFGNYEAKFFLENAQLLWMLREEPITTFPDGIPYISPHPELEVKKRIKCLEEQRLENLEAS